MRRLRLAGGRVEGLRLLHGHRYPGEGWGLCFDGRRLVMIGGSSRLVFRDPTSFDRTGGVTVEHDGGRSPPQRAQCTGDAVSANIWLEERMAGSTRRRDR